MEERLKQIRKTMKLTQDEFAKRLGLTKNYIYLMEAGRNPIADRVVKDICREFDVNETWFRTGEGEMKAPQTKQSEIASITAQLFHKSDTDPETYSFLVELNKYLLQLNEDQMQAVLCMIRKLNAAVGSAKELEEK